ALHGFTHFSTSHGPPPDYYADLDMTADHAGGYGTALGEGGAFMIRTQRELDDSGAAAGTNFLEHPFLIVFDGILPTAVSGQIWDIDRAAGGSDPFPTEQYLLEALDINGLVLDALDSPSGL